MRRDPDGINSRPQPPCPDFKPTPIECRETSLAGLFQLAIEPRHVPEQVLVARLNEPSHMPFFQRTVADPDPGPAAVRQVQPRIQAQARRWLPRGWRGDRVSGRLVTHATTAVRSCRHHTPLS